MIFVEATAIDPDRLVAMRECVVVFSSGETSGVAAASLLLGDFAVMSPPATLRIDSPAAWAAVVWRIGGEALRLLAAGRTMWSAHDALDHGLIDAVTEEARSLFTSRSALALDAAAMLIGCRGGDELERAEFARLFAIGEPRRGLAAFLGKRTARF